MVNAQSNLSAPGSCIYLKVFFEQICTPTQKGDSSLASWWPQHSADPLTRPSVSAETSTIPLSRKVLGVS